MVVKGPWLSKQIKDPFVEKKHLETSRRAIIVLCNSYICHHMSILHGHRHQTTCILLNKTGRAVRCLRSHNMKALKDFPLYQVTFHFVWCWSIFDLPAIQQLWHHFYLLICYSDQTDAFGRRRGGRSYVARVPSNLSRPDQQGVSGCVIVLRLLAFMCVICQEA